MLVTSQKDGRTRKTEMEAGLKIFFIALGVTLGALIALLVRAWVLSRREGEEEK